MKAVDGGTPALSDSTIVEIDVEDKNDNAPIFNHCNMTAVVQVFYLPFSEIAIYQ